MSNEHQPWLKHYDPGVPAELKIPAISLVDLFNQSVAENASSVCLIFRGKTLTYQEVDALSESFARFLLAQGLKKGERVGVFLGNVPEFVISYYGILKAGGVVMALNPAYKPPEVQAQAVESGARFLVLPESAYPMAKRVQSGTYIESLIVVGGKHADLEEFDFIWEVVLSHYQGQSSVDILVSPDDPAVFQYSGGTTGTPKCAVGLHRNLVANVTQFSHWLVNTKPGEETVLVAIPVYHVYGMVLGMNLAVAMGARMVLIPDPRDLDHLLTAADAYQATIFPGVPNIYAAINHYPPVLEGKYNLSSIKACISGSAPLPLKVKQEFEALTHGHLVEGYGLSEAPTATHCNPVLGDNREGSIGLPLPNVDCRIVDLETGTKEMPKGGIGELVIRGPQVMVGYHERPDETALAIRDGWLYTGDVARMDADGYFYLVDRKKDVIKVGGFQVWPNEIEAVLMKHPKVREAAVAGVFEPEGTEVSKAWVVLKEGETLTAEALREFCGEYLTRYKIPEYVEFRQSLPRTMVGKVLRRLLVSEHSD